MVIHTRWSRNLGAPRVQMELGEELQSLGHQVEKLSYEDAFPEIIAARRRNRLGRLAEVVATNRSFAARARAFVQAHGRRFDVIDANQTDLPFPKAKLGFEGLLVARSVGLIPAYAEFERMAARRWPEPFNLRSLVYRTLTHPGHRRRQRDALESFRHADLINVSNQDDLATVRDGMGFGDRVVAFPFGLREDRRAAFRRCRAGVEERLARRTVVFIGAWNPRKGSKDWPRIAAAVRCRLPQARFLFLGTGHDEAFVRRDFPGELQPALEVVPTYDGDQLPELLARATVGAFPGYLEGFGFSVLEKLASGLPVVAYDAVGPREMLRHQELPTTVPPGEVATFSHRLVHLLTLDPESYGRHGADSDRVADRFCWPRIARETLAVYERRLTRLHRGSGSP